MSNYINLGQYKEITTDDGRVIKVLELHASSKTLDQINH